MSAEIRLFNRYRHLLRRLADFGDLRLKHRKRHAEAGSQIASHPSHRHRIGAIGIDFQVKQHIVLQCQRLSHIASQFGCAGQNQNPRVFAIRAAVWQFQLFSRAQHPLRPFAPQLAAFDLQPAGHDRALGCQRNQVAHLHIERSAADLAGIARAVVHIHKLDAVGIGMRAQGEHFGHHDAVKRGPQSHHFFHAEAEVGQVLGEDGRILL